MRRKGEGRIRFPCNIHTTGLPLIAVSVSGGRQAVTITQSADIHRQHRTDLSLTCDHHIACRGLVHRQGSRGGGSGLPFVAVTINVGDDDTDLPTSIILRQGETLAGIARHKGLARFAVGMIDIDPFPITAARLPLIGETVIIVIDRHAVRVGQFRHQQIADLHLTGDGRRARHIHFHIRVAGRYKSLVPRIYNILIIIRQDVANRIIVRRHRVVRGGIVDGGGKRIDRIGDLGRGRLTGWLGLLQQFL